ncbi:MAG: LytTR family DNA-binding domain-containing protein [Bacteroidota bacterium]
MNKITAAIVDDEQLARTRIRRLLQDKDEIEIIAECSDGLSAVETLNELKPDLVFLDVQMPEMNGFEVLENIDYSPLPLIIFATAYDKYAIKAFDVHAVDYLLKPFDDDRFEESLNLAKEKIGSAERDQLTKNIFNLLGDTSKTSNDYIDRLVVKTDGRMYFVKTKDIIRIKAAGKHLDIKTGEKNHLIRKTMNQIETTLDPDQFIRIHRSAIINIDHIKEIQYWYKNEYIFIMSNNEKIASSSSYRKNLEKVLDK